MYPIKALVKHFKLFQLANVIGKQNCIGFTLEFPFEEDLCK